MVFNLLYIVLPETVETREYDAIEAEFTPDMSHIISAKVV